MQIVNKGVHRKQETRIHQISLLMKYSFVDEGQILDSYDFVRTSDSYDRHQSFAT